MFSKKNPKQSPSESKTEAQPVAEPDAENASAESSAEPQPADASIPEAPAPTAASAEPQPEVVDELAVMKDRYARLLADFDNYRKRQLREREDLIKRANEDLLGDLLPVIDNMELALAKSPDPDAPFVVGVKLVYDQFLALLDRCGMTPLDTKGEPFDPTYHEALSQMSSDTVPANTIIEQFRRGWLLAGRLLRPAQVIVSSGAPEPQSEEPEAEKISE